MRGPLTVEPCTVSMLTKGRSQWATCWSKYHTCTMTFTIFCGLPRVIWSHKLTRPSCPHHPFNHPTAQQEWPLSVDDQSSNLTASPQARPQCSRQGSTPAAQDSGDQPERNQTGNSKLTATSRTRSCHQAAASHQAASLPAAMSFPVAMGSGAAMTIAKLPTGLKSVLPRRRHVEISSASWKATLTFRRPHRRRKTKISLMPATKKIHRTLIGTTSIRSRTS